MLALGLTVSDVSALAVGAGTGALAFVTWKLARRTKEDVDLSRRGLALTRESIEALDMPFLVASFDLEYPSVNLSPVFEGDSEEPVDAEWTVGMKVENVGRGPAILFGAIAIPDGVEDEPDGFWAAELPFKPGQAQELSVRTTVDPDPGRTLRLILRYRSASGRSYVTRHRVRIGRGGGTARLDIRRESVGSDSTP
jgi:hypothetical protein